MKFVRFESFVVKWSSLPSWERGLKSCFDNITVSNALSLPSWERGLKFLFDDETTNDSLSLPSWERGLKLSRLGKMEILDNVAPLVGAWIEIAK